jgi:hypothetical protein
VNDYERAITTIGILKPRFSKDGSMFCFLYGENLEDGVCGFGETPYAAPLIL